MLNSTKKLSIQSIESQLTTQITNPNHNNEEEEERVADQ